MLIKECEAVLIDQLLMLCEEVRPGKVPSAVKFDKIRRRGRLRMATARFLD
jgi:hypothetical protein